MPASVDYADGKFAAVHRTWLRMDGIGKAALREPNCFAVRSWLLLLN